jgi:hypothetical protein
MERASRAEKAFVGGLEPGETGLRSQLRSQGTLHRDNPLHRPARVLAGPGIGVIENWLEILPSAGIGDFTERCRAFRLLLRPGRWCARDKG